MARPVVLCILDGVGRGAGGEDDAVATARTPVLDALYGSCPWRELRAHGTAVGLPTDDDMGNSEVGHNAMGAGRIFDQGAKLVDNALSAGSAFETDVWKRLVQGKTLHLLGLCSDGNVHSNVTHLHTLLERAEADGVKRVRLHLLTDGRDVSGRSALTWFEPLEERLEAMRARGVDARIGSGGGRMLITMDRYEADWDMVERGYRCHVLGEGERFERASEAIRSFYEADPDIDDQYLPAFVVTVDGEPCGRMADGDSVLFFNFRGDRALEISRALGDAEFGAFDVSERPELFYAGMMEYDGDLHIPTNYLVPPPAIDSVVGQHLAAAGKRSFACSETQKFGHVTFFFNGNRSGRLDEQLETWLEIPSDLQTPDTRPWMKAAEITDAVIDALETGSYDHIRLNYANGDMVGHTGDLAAARLALECVDLCLGRLTEAVRRADGVLLVTADHGNADEMLQRKKGQVLTDDDGRPLKKTSHTLNPVPLIVYDPRGEVGLADVPDAGIANLGATVLALCGVTPPDDYLPSLVQP